MKIIIRISIFIIIMITKCFSQDLNYENGLIAFDNKDYIESIKLLKSYADSGDAKAQFVMGYCYWLKENSFSNDSIAEYYLLKSSEQKFGRAMGILATHYFGKKPSSSQTLIDAYLWAEIAAAIDPIQAMTTTRKLIKLYMSPEDIKKADSILKKINLRLLVKIDLKIFKSN